MSEPDFTIENLGTAKNPSPIAMSKIDGDFIADYVTDDQFVIPDPRVTLGAQKSLKRGQVFECAGPREHIYFMPSHVHAGIVS
ncbi:MAG: ATP-dependent 6-phosphofructokinase, partial [Spirochaetaceae bacterium]|nr:ATP-dependent 6-phosphofructokinase [Spirochaetaceae bacterium]